MNKKDILKKENFTKTTKKDLTKCYKYTYKCKKCLVFYGSDRKELGTLLCPICEEEVFNKQRWKQK